jgi:hypothetical protein
MKRVIVVMRDQDLLCLQRFKELTGAGNMSEAIRRALRDALEVALARRAAAGERPVFEVAP